MLNNIKWIFFDIGSTLVDESNAYKHRIEETVQNTDISFRQFYDKMICFYKQNKNGYKEAAGFFGLGFSQWHTEDEILYPQARDCLEFLSQKYKIGIIANQLPGAEERLKNFGISDYISLVIASAEEKYAKPDLRIFRLALLRASCTPQNAAMVGDRLDNDIAPAKYIGMKTIRVKQGFAGYTEPQNYMQTADFTVDTLHDVCRLFECC